jgi:general nucleoside transport system permease protein
MIDANAVVLLLAATLALAAPLLFAALGELISERAGILNINLEAMMLGGAFCGVWAASATASLFAGFVGAALAGIVIAAIHGVLCIALRAEQVVSGVALNILVLGATTYGVGAVFGSNVSRSVETLTALPIPFLSGLPFAGRVLFDQTATTYIAFLLVPLMWWAINRTVVGLALQATGEQATAAMSMGVNIRLVRWTALLTCGALAGIGGGQLTLAGLGTFTQNVTAGRGFIALAAVVFGRWTPSGAMVAILLFTIIEALQVRAQILGINLPYQFLVMAPYLATILALALFMKRMKAPRGLGINI